MRFALIFAVGCAFAVPAGVWSQPAKDALVDRIDAVFESRARGNMHQSADSGTLAWGESTLLNTCLWMYRATGDAKWLDRLVEHADSIFSAISVGEDGRPGWRTPRYSIAYARVAEPARGDSQARLLPETQDIWDVNSVAKVTGHTYRLWFPRDGHLVVHDLDTQHTVGETDVAAGDKIDLVPGVSLTMEGRGRAGDSFLVKTVAPKALDYVVHDGMILTPVCGFIDVVVHDPGLERFGGAARRYLDVIEARLVHKWDPMWVNLGDGGGAYLAPDDPAQRFRGCTLPHNQYLALGRAFIALYRATGEHWYRERAEKMGRFFKSNLRLVEDHYEWNYWDPAIPRDEEGVRMRHPEDTSHGHIDVGFAVDAYEAGLVFTRDDMARLANTLLAMWNGSMESPGFGAVVGRKGDQVSATADWILLGAFDTKLSEILAAVVSKWDDQDAGRALAAAQWLACSKVRSEAGH